MTRVLTFSTHISAGHRRAAEAVADAILAADPTASIVDRDAMTLMGRRRGRVLADTYLGILRYRPSLWNFLYRNKKLKGRISSFFRLYLSRALEKFEAEIDQYKPDVIICTQAIPARVISQLKEQGRCNVPLLCVATDYQIHAYWSDPHVDAYAVPCEEAEEQLVADDVDRSRIRVTGIPVHGIFEYPPRRAEARRALGLKPNGRYALIMGGGNGLGLSASDVVALESISELDGVLVISGSNTALDRELRDLPSSGKERYLWQSVDGIEQFYAAVDLLVSKPGGLTMAEATAMSLPIVMIAPLPGQEVRNAEFLRRAGAAHSAADADELRACVADLLKNPSALQRLTECSGRVGRPGASRVIAEMALSMARRPAPILS